MHIALLTMFNDLSPTYSLVTVVKEQTEMLLAAGHNVSILISEHCSLNACTGIFLDSRINWCPIINSLNNERMTWYDYTSPNQLLHDTFAEEVQLISTDFVHNLQDVDICILHDILFQGWHYIHNIAIRLAQKHLPDIRFIAFTHSRPSPPPDILSPTLQARFTRMPYTLFAYPTQSGIPSLARQYQIPEGLCRVVNNSLSPISFLSSEVQSIHEQINLLNSEILIIYPGRLTPSKGFEKVAKLAGALSHLSSGSIKLIFCDFQSLDIDPTLYKKQIRENGTQFGLSSSSIFFTSELGFEKGITRQSVLDLFTLSNLFICPSFSESFGLTILEAASRGNLIVLNENVPSLYELGCQLHTYFMQWDALGERVITANYSTTEKEYYNNNAAILYSQLHTNPISYSKTLTRLRYSPNWIYKHQLEPLLISAKCLTS